MRDSYVQSSINELLNPLPTPEEDPGEQPEPSGPSPELTAKLKEIVKVSNTVDKLFKDPEALGTLLSFLANEDGTNMAHDGTMANGNARVLRDLELATWNKASYRWSLTDLGRAVRTAAVAKMNWMLEQTNPTFVRMDDDPITLKTMNGEIKISLQEWSMLQLFREVEENFWVFDRAGIALDYQDGVVMESLHAKDLIYQSILHREWALTACARDWAEGRQLRLTEEGLSSLSANERAAVEHIFHNKGLVFDHKFRSTIRATTLARSNLYLTVTSLKSRGMIESVRSEDSCNYQLTELGTRIADLMQKQQ